MGNSRKPWLKYRNTDKPARKYHSLKPQRRTTRLALFYLIVAGGVGGYKFYLGKMKQGWVLFVIFYILFIISLIVFDTYQAFIIGTYFLMVFLFEVGSLKQQVKLRNIKLGYHD